MRSKPSIVAIVLTVGTFVAGCGSQSGVATSVSASASAAVGSGTATSSLVTSSASSASGSSAESSSANSSAHPSVAGSPVASAAPKRIVSLSPTATEDLFAIGADKQVVAVDSASNFPSTAPITKLSAFEPNVESIAKYKPDLVVISDDINNIKAQLTKLSIPVLVEPAAASLNDAYAQIESLGKATGHTPEAAKTVTDMRSGIAALVAAIPGNTKKLTYFHELDNTLYTVSAKTFVGQIYTLAGLKDIADPVNSKGTAYPQLSAEYLIKANPNLIFLADTKCCQQNAATFAARPGFSVLTAVRDKHVVPLDDDVASRWGPRVVQLLQKIVDAAKSARSS